MSCINVFMKMFTGLPAVVLSHVLRRQLPCSEQLKQITVKVEQVTVMC
jgi:hypothetical protein